MLRVNNPPTNKFVDGDPSTGTVGTRVLAAWLNTIQEELAHIVENAGMTLDPGDTTQVLKALTSNIALFPAGFIFPVIGRDDPPPGSFELDGAEYSRTTYVSLFSESPLAIGTRYGDGDGSTTFNLADFRGYVPRGWDHGAGVDPDAAGRTDRGDGIAGDAIGTKQTDEFGNHRHFVGSTDSHTELGGLTNQEFVRDYGSGSGPATSSSYAGGNETRMKNINVMWCIKY